MDPREEELHSELARANLLRLRGDFAQAEQICLKALERFPQSAAAHTLLGDIAFSQDHIPESVQHYEVALSLDPHAPDIPRKLEDARVLTQIRETASTEEQLGLPPKRPIPWAAVAFGGLAVMSLVAAAVAGLANNSPNQKGKPTASVAAPISATSETLATAAAVTPPANAADIQKPAVTVPEPTPPPTTVSMSLPMEDRTLFQLLQQRSQEGARLIQVSQDPRTKMVALTYSVSGEEDPQKVGAELARTTLDQSSETLIVTLRAVRDERLVYLADVPRTRYADTLTDEWRQQNPAADAWAGYVVTNEWPYRSTDAGAPKTP